MALIYASFGSYVFLPLAVLAQTARSATTGKIECMIAVVCENCNFSQGKVRQRAVCNGEAGGMPSSLFIVRCTGGNGWLLDLAA